MQPFSHTLPGRATMQVFRLLSRMVEHGEPSSFSTRTATCPTPGRDMASIIWMVTIGCLVGCALEVNHLGVMSAI